MSANTKVNVDFIAEYKGAQNLKRAHSDIAGLTGGLKKLAGAFGIAFAGREIINFGKASVQAFATNQKQVAILNNTLKNLGKSYAALSANTFIDHLALATGVTKEELIPAFQGLLIATGDVTTAQNELQLAMNISAGTGKDLSIVQIALSKAYLGNYTGLTRLGAGLSKTILATKDMKLINQQLAATFKGDMVTAADTVEGKMARLTVAMTEAKVAIGTGLVQAFGELAGSSDFNNTLDKIVAIGTSIGNLVIDIERLSKLGSGLSLFNMVTDPFTTFKKALNFQDEIIKKDKQDKAAPLWFGTSLVIAKKLAADKAKSDTTALANAKAQTKAKADQLAIERATLSLKLAGSTTDMQNIEIQAALQRGQTDQVNNVLLLQRAILNGNADQATILSQEVLKANGLAMDINGNISSIKDAKNPFAGWPTASAAAIAQVQAIQDALDKLRDKTIKVTVQYFTTGMPSINGSGFDPLAQIAAAGALRGAGSGGSSVTNQSPITSQYPNYGLQTTDGSFTVPSSVTGNIPDSSSSNPMSAYQSYRSGERGDPIVINITAPQNTIVDTTQAASTNGTAVIVNRNNPFGSFTAA